VSVGMGVGVEPPPPGGGAPGGAMGGEAAPPPPAQALTAVLMSASAPSARIREIAVFCTDYPS